MVPLVLGTKRAHSLNEKRNERGNREIMKSEYTLEVKYHKA